MKKEKMAAVLAIVTMVLISMIASVYYNSKHKEDLKITYTALKPAPVCNEPLVGIDEEKDFLVNEEFSTHLPLVILDFTEEEPPIYMEKSKGGDFVKIEGVEPYVPGEFFLIDNEDGENHLQDTPAISSLINIKRRGNTSMIYEKAQWTLKFVTESGQYRDIDVLGMGKEHEWILNGSLADKSMIRNYLAYSISSEVMPNVPDAQFCEVILKKDDNYYYHGVYLLEENIKQGLNRVNIAQYDKNSLVNSFIVRRDRYDEDGIMLDTYGRLNGYTETYWGMISPSKNQVTDEMIAYTEESINAVEEILYSNDEKCFNTYSDVIDTKSFADYFILNEFFSSYDAGNYSTYAYKDLGGKLCMGPVWDFDGTMDNYVMEPAEPKDLGFVVKPWFDRLCQDKAFVRLLRNEYEKLRTGPLSEQHISNKVSEIVEHLGGATEREWARWNVWYTGIYGTPPIGLHDFEDEDGVLLHRNAESLDEELYRMKTNLHEHGEAIPNALSDLLNTAKKDSGLIRWKEWMLAIALLAILMPSVYIMAKK